MRMHALTLVLIAFVGCIDDRRSDAGIPFADRDAGASDSGSAFTGGDAGPKDAGCQGPGLYTAGRTEGYRPRSCCAGLTEVRYPHAGYVGPGDPYVVPDVEACVFFFDIIYGCVRGRCGDGKCEVGEAPACGCVADCPDAAWGPQDAGAAPTDGGVSS